MIHHENMFKLLIANLKMTFRDKQAIFWSLVFPVMFIIIFGLFNFENMGNAKYILIDQANSELAGQFKDEFQKIEFLKAAAHDGTLDQAVTKLKNGDVDFIIVVPPDFTFAVPAAQNVQPGIVSAKAAAAVPEPPAVGAIKVYYDESNISINQVFLSVVDKFLDKMNLAIANAPARLSYSTENIQAKKIKYIDILMPGILGMAIMTSSVIGISAGITRYREQRLLKRLAATPLKVRDFLAAEVLSYLIVNLLQVTLIILVARLAFKVHVYGNYFILYAVCLIGGIIFLNLGFAVAGYSKNTKTAEALAQVITMPMMFFSGVFFSTEALPKAVATIVQFLPLTPFVDALRKVSIDAGTWPDIWPKLAFMAGWIVVSFLIAWRSFRFKDA